MKTIAILRRNDIKNTASIIAGGLDRIYGRAQIGHGDHSAELACRLRYRQLQRRSVAQMNMPVVGFTDQKIGHAPDEHIRLQRKVEIGGLGVEQWLKLTAGRQV